MGLEQEELHQDYHSEWWEWWKEDEA